ncbi:S41 family peptidase [Pedobacter jeongneungensis]|uniref:S41 family peptidase n=1 Tax=Pedobacter jeongneungensis TaxID=947309 RepID=UPI0013B38956|nr:S41 family peptidase [Pedobacter jeongneungensis]
MKFILTSVLLLFLISSSSFGQTCNCSQEFNDVKNKIEKNYAGFKDKVNAKTEATYHKRTQVALEQSQSITSPAQCVYLINEWLAFFKDGHIQIGRNRISKEIEEAKLKERIQAIEHLNLSNEELTNLKNTKGITGIYWNEDSTSRIAVIKNKTRFRDYAGVVVSSKPGKWLPGQVVLELKRDKDMLKGIMYDRYYIPTNVSLQIRRDALGSFKMEGSKQSSTELISDAAVASKILSTKTLYIKISTFNQSNAKNIDSLFKANRSNLSKMPYLILDLRNNGGGADFSYRPITPYLYTNTFREIGADVLSTSDNIAGWAAIATTNGLPPDQKVFISDVIEKMEQSKGKLVSFSDDHNVTLDSVKPYPQKVIILINKNCGSTTEEFLLLAKQSSKVTLMGEHTAGVLDYSNVRGADFSCMPYMLYWATSRSRRIDEGIAIDNIGIMPDKVLKPEQNWIDEAKHYAEK